MPGPVSTQSTLFLGKKSNGQRPNTSSPIQRSKQAIKARLGRLSVDMYSRENTGKIVRFSATISRQESKRRPELCRQSRPLLCKTMHTVARIITIDKQLRSIKVVSNW